jgi:hypothetical protein
MSPTLSRRKWLSCAAAAATAVSAWMVVPTASAQDPAAGVRHAIKAIWDKPGAPVDVSPVSVVGKHAIAGWTQEDRGGRALLRQEHGKWVVTVCGGDGLIKTDALLQTGMSKSEAESLSKATQKAEAAIPAERRKKFALFEGMVKVDASHKPGDQGHGAHKH